MPSRLSPPTRRGLLLPTSSKPSPRALKPGFPWRKLLILDSRLGTTTASVSLSFFLSLTRSLSFSLSLSFTFSHSLPFSLSDSRLKLLPVGFRAFGVVGVVVVEVAAAVVTAEDEEEADEDGTGSGVVRAPERADERREDKPAR